METSVLELTLPPDWNAVRSAWDPCRGVLVRSGLGEDEAYSLAMVAQELLENAVKYGAGDADAIRLSLRVDEGDVTVEVRNRLGVDDANSGRSTGRGAVGSGIARIPSRPTWSGSSPRPPGPTTRAGAELGLARIAYEGRCALDFCVDAAASSRSPPSTGEEEVRNDRSGEAVGEGELSLEAHPAPGELRVIWRGRSADREPGQFLLPSWRSCSTAAGGARPGSAWTSRRSTT